LARDLLGQGESDPVGGEKARIDAAVEQVNTAILDDFDGLIPRQMHEMIGSPMTSCPLIGFPATRQYQPTAPILDVVTLLLTRLGEKGHKATANGNLPRQFCREVLKAYFGDEYAEVYKYGEPQKETDASRLHRARLLCVIGRLLALSKSRWRVTKKGSKLLAEESPIDLYVFLLEVFVKKYNWAYGGRVGEFPILQAAAGFIARLLSRHGDQWRDVHWYAERIMTAFPQMLDEVDRLGPHAEIALRSTIVTRALFAFLQDFGLGVPRKFSRRSDPVPNLGTQIQKTPLLDALFRFHV